MIKWNKILNKRSQYFFWFRVWMFLRFRLRCVWKKWKKHFPNFFCYSIVQTSPKFTFIRQPEFVYREKRDENPTDKLITWTKPFLYQNSKFLNDPYLINNTTLLGSKCDWSFNYSTQIFMDGCGPGSMSAAAKRHHWRSIWHAKRRRYICLKTGFTSRHR